MTKEDIIGNVITEKTGSSETVIMFTAHADEIGLMIKFVSPDGYLYFNTIGGIDLAILPGSRVVIVGIEGDVYGVIGRRPVHHMGADAGTGPINVESLWIDIGACDKETALERVRLGAKASIVSERIHLTDTLLAGRGLDNSVGVDVIRQLSKSLERVETGHTIYFVETVQEEIGCRGAQVAAANIQPDVCVVIDVTHATDYPGCNQARYGDIKLGKGVVIAISPDTDKKLSDMLISIAEEHNIPYQIEPHAFPTGTEAKIIQTTGSGIRTALVSVPCRYMHTPNEVVSIEDVNAAKKLLEEFCKTKIINE